MKKQKRAFLKVVLIIFGFVPLLCLFIYRSLSPIPALLCSCRSIGHAPLPLGNLDQKVDNFGLEGTRHVITISVEAESELPSVSLGKVLPSSVNKNEQPNGNNGIFYYSKQDGQIPEAGCRFVRSCIALLITE